MNHIVDMVLVGIDFRAPKQETVLTLRDKKTTREIVRVRKSIDYGAELLMELQVEVTEDEKYYLETGNKIIRK